MGRAACPYGAIHADNDRSVCSRRAKHCVRVRVVTRTAGCCARESYSSICLMRIRVVDCVLQPFLETRIVDEHPQALHMRGALDLGSFATRVVSHLLTEQVEQEVAILGEPLVVESQHALHRGLADRLASAEDLLVETQRVQKQRVASNVSLDSNARHVSRTMVMRHIETQSARILASSACPKHVATVVQLTEFGVPRKAVRRAWCDPLQWKAS